MADSSPIRGLLLASAGTRLASALVAVACIWGAVLWARASQGAVLADDGSRKTIALRGAAAPGIPTGTFAEFDAPALNNRDGIVVLANVRRGRETLQALYLFSNGRLRKLIATGDA